MRRIIHKTSLHILGWLCLLIGIAGLVLPIIPGLVFIAIAVYFFSLASEWLGIKVESIKDRHPMIKHHYDKFDTKANKYFKKTY
jgi:uncharacterized membrane protein YbaN (DUF454 family)